MFACKDDHHESLLYYQYQSAVHDMNVLDSIPHLPKICMKLKNA